jgi:molybdopterin-binding protein
MRVIIELEFENLPSRVDVENYLKELIDDGSLFYHLAQREIMSTVITGDDTILFSIIALESALRLEVKGMKMSMGRSAYAIVKARYGLKGNKKQVLEQFNEIVNALREERGLPVKELQTT